MSDATFKLNPKDSDKFSGKLMDSFLTNNVLVIKIYSRRILSLPEATQAKVFRYLLMRMFQITIDTSQIRSTLNNILYKTGSDPRIVSWSQYITIKNLKILSEIINLIRLSEISRKILTIKRIPELLLISNPDDVNFLFNNKLVLLSANIGYQKCTNHYTSLQDYNLKYSLELLKVKEMIPDTILDNGLDIMRFDLKSLITMVKNLENLASIFKSRDDFILKFIQPYVVKMIDTISTKINWYSGNPLPKEKYRDELKKYNIEPISNEELISHLNNLYIELLGINQRLFQQGCSSEIDIKFSFNSDLPIFD